MGKRQQEEAFRWGQELIPNLLMDRACSCVFLHVLIPSLLRIHSSTHTSCKHSLRGHSAPNGKALKRGKKMKTGYAGHAHFREATLSRGEN